jgi:Membrane protease subunits, stomatin/prohibitin homologs
MARYEDLLDEEPLAPRKRGWRSFIWRHLLAVTTPLLVALLMIVVLWPYVVITVPSGRVGVYWKRINNFDFYCWCFNRGTILDPRELRNEGLHFIWPWDKLFIYDLRLQSTTQTINAISKDGVNVTAQINVRYQLAHRAVAVLHKFIGPQYLETVINPEVGSVAREVISKYTAEEVYTRAMRYSPRFAPARRRAWAPISTSWCSPRRRNSLTPSTTTIFCKVRSRFSTYSYSASTCPRRWSMPSIRRLRSST